MRRLSCRLWERIAPRGLRMTNGERRDSGNRGRYTLVVRPGLRTNLARSENLIGCCRLAKRGRYVSIAASNQTGNTTDRKTQRYLLMYRRVSVRGRS